MAGRRGSRNSPAQGGFMENIVGGLANSLAGTEIYKYAVLSFNCFKNITKMILFYKDQLFDNLSLQSASYIRQHASPGDLLEFNRGLYSHYALYLGQGKVMNVDAEEKTTKSALICEKMLEDVCGGCRVRVRNHDEVAKKYFQTSPKSVHEIIHSAKSYKNSVVPYELHFRNCEYYSTLWRYGKGFSTQVI